MIEKDQTMYLFVLASLDISKILYQISNCICLMKIPKTLLVSFYADISYGDNILTTKI